MAVCSLCSTAFPDLSLWRRAQHRPCRTAAGGVSCRHRPVKLSLIQTKIPHWRRCSTTDLSLEYLGRGDGESHKSARLLHTETICLVHWHTADCQCFRVMAASFGQTHVPFENVQHSVLFYRVGHYNLRQNVLLSPIVYVFMSVHILIECSPSVKQLSLNP